MLLRNDLYGLYQLSLLDSSIITSNDHLFTQNLSPGFTHVFRYFHVDLLEEIKEAMYGPVVHTATSGHHEQRREELQNSKTWLMNCQHDRASML